MKVLGIGGEPATGKTTLVRTLMDALGAGWKRRKAGLVEYHEHPGGHVVLGKYRDGDVFSGTDKLSMAVQPAAKTLLDAWTEGRQYRNVIFEGDRLYSPGFLQYCEQSQERTCQWYRLMAPEEAVSERRAGREGNQDPSWLKGRRTKLEGIDENFTVLHRQHADAEATRLLVADMLWFINS